MSLTNSSINSHPAGHIPGYYNLAQYVPTPPLAANPAIRYTSLPPPRSIDSTRLSTPPKVSLSTVTTVSYTQQHSSVSVTECMTQAYEECRAIVLRIAEHCRARNRKFRDVEFDIENDPTRCLYSLYQTNIFSGTSDVLRVPEIFDNPVFYSGTTKSAEVVQGAVEDCYLVSALSTMTSMNHLIQKFCVARDEEVGIYGFIFHRDSYWVPVVVDDLLFTRAPRYEQLMSSEKELYHFEKEKYNETARKGPEILYFSRPVNGSQETWIPLVEKAYAKLHGDYASLMFGRTCDAIEDMTGGVSSLILTRDILDKDKFWSEELMKANEDRLFGCWFKPLPGVRSGVRNASVDGLVGNLSHSIVRAVEIKGKRFVVIRDPWGDAGWEGPWSDGSKEWTKDWLEILPELGHSFGDKGQFVMEYKDFLNLWQEIQRTLVFDDTWVMSSQWLHVAQPFPCMDAFSYGDISFTFSLASASPTVIALSKYDIRYFRDIQGPCMWNVDFIIAKEGEKEALAESSYSFFYTRSVSVELNLEAGNYVILGRLDPVPVRHKDYFKRGLDSGWDRRKLARIMTERAKGQSIAANYTPNTQLLPALLPEILSGEAVKVDKVTMDAIKTHGGNINPGESLTVSTTTTTSTVIHKKTSSMNDPLSQYAQPDANANDVNGINCGPGIALPYAPVSHPGWVGTSNRPPTPTPPKVMQPSTPYVLPNPLPPPHPTPPLPPGPADPRPAPPTSRTPSPPLPDFAPPLMTDILEDDNSIVVGLKVFTMKDVPTMICGRVKNSRQSKQAGKVRY